MKKMIIAYIALFLTAVILLIFPEFYLKRKLERLKLGPLAEHIILSSPEYSFYLKTYYLDKKKINSLYIHKHLLNHLFFDFNYSLTNSLYANACADVSAKIFWDAVAKILEYYQVTADNNGLLEITDNVVGNIEKAAPDIRRHSLGEHLWLNCDEKTYRFLIEQMSENKN